MRTCPEFVEAFLLGLNHRALGELAWRQHPVAVGCTPLRRFWDATSRRRRGGRHHGEDVRPVKGWPVGSRLGSHAPTGCARSGWSSSYAPRSSGAIPARCCSSRRAVRRPAGARATSALDRPVMPRSVAAMSPDLTMFAFDVDPDVIAEHWVVVQEMPEGIRFERTHDRNATAPAGRRRTSTSRCGCCSPGPSTVGLSGGGG